MAACRRADRWRHERRRCPRPQRRCSHRREYRAGRRPPHPPCRRPANPDLVERVRAAKPELLAALSRPPSPAASTYAGALAALIERCPDCVEKQRRRQCIADAERFLTQWDQQAAALGWTERDPFGLHEPPDRPHPSYRCLSRRDCIGLVWLLQGAPVVALTADAAAIETADRTSRLMYYRPAATSAVPASMSSDGSRSTTSSSTTTTGAGGNEGNALSRDSRVGPTH